MKINKWRMLLTNKRRALKLTMWLGVVVVMVGTGFIFYEKGILKADVLTNTFNQAITNEEVAAANVTAETNGMRILKSDEFAVIGSDVSQVAESDKDKISPASLVVNGKTLELSNPQAINNIIYGDNQKPVMVPESLDNAIHSISEYTDKDKKVEPSMESDSTNNGRISVIIQMEGLDTPYESDDGVIDRWLKKKDFQYTRSDIVADILGHGQVRDDLFIASSITAEVDQTALEKLEENPNVKKIEKINYIQILLDGSVPQINTDYAWTQSGPNDNLLTGAGEKIAIIDTGVDYSHLDLGGCIGESCKVIGGYDFVNNDFDPMDDQGHGTHVAATAAGKGFLNGVAPDAKIVAYKVCDREGSCEESNVIKAIQKAVDPNGDGDPSDHADVGSISLGGLGNPDNALNQAVDNATVAGMVFTIAAGNSGAVENAIKSPGTARSAITVAAACKTQDVGGTGYCTQPIANFSSRGPLIWLGEDISKPDIAAPGVNICAALANNYHNYNTFCKDGRHISISGTSMATPHVAGAVALIRQAYPNLTPQQVKDLLKSNARDLGMDYNSQGAGLVDLKSAIPSTEKITIDTPVWHPSTDPSVKNSNLAKTISVTSNDISINSLDVSIEAQFPSGIAVDLDKQTLQMADRGSDSFNLSVAVDNDLVQPGTYQGIIYYKTNDQSQGASIFYITVLPTIVLNPSITGYYNHQFDFGTADPSVPIWTSADETRTITNLRKDISQTLSFNLLGFPSGVTLNFNSQPFVIPPGENQQFSINLAVDNSQVGFNDYQGTITMTSGYSFIKFSGRFSKFYVLNIDTSDNIETYAHRITVLSRQNGIIADLFGGISLGVRDPVVYSPFDDLDAIAIYGPRGSGNRGDVRFVIKENISFQSGVTNLNMAKGEAGNSLALEAYDSDNRYHTEFGSSFYSLDYKGQKLLGLSNTTFSNYLVKGETLVTNASNNYSLKVLFRDPEDDAQTRKIHYFAGTFNNFQNSQKITVNSSDLRATTFKTSIWKSSDSYPSMYTALVANRELGYMVEFLDMDWAKHDRHKPLWNQVLYTNRGSNLFLEDFRLMFQQLTFKPSYGTVSQSPLVDLFDKTRQLYIYPLGEETKIPPLIGDTVYNGFDGLRFWIAKIRQSGVWPPFLVEQEYSYPDSLDLRLKSSILNSSIYYCDGNVRSLRLQGKILFPYVVGDICQIDFDDIPYDVIRYEGGAPYFVPLEAQMKLIIGTNKRWNSLLQLNSLQLYSNDILSNSYLNDSTNKLRFGFSTVEETGVSQINLSYSTDNLNFTPMDIEEDAQGYFSEITQPFNQQIIYFKLNATDSAQNSFELTFQVPIEEKRFSENQLPVITISEPVSNTDSSFILQANAQDNIGLDKVEFYGNGTKIGEAGETPIQFIWETKNVPSGQYAVQAKAFDIFGNIGDSNIVNVTISNPIEPTPTPTLTPTPTPTPTPSETPSSTPTPTPAPTPTSTPTETAMPTPTPTPAPSSSPTPTPTVSNISPSPAPTPTPTTTPGTGSGSSRRKISDTASKIGSKIKGQLNKTLKNAKDKLDKASKKIKQTYKNIKDKLKRK